MSVSASQIEAIGKVGAGVIAIIVLGYILHLVLGENRDVIEALSKQVELAERQTIALEQLVRIYTGRPIPSPPQP